MTEQTIRDVEDLKVFRKAYDLSLDVHQASLKFPKHEQVELASQLRKSSKSVCANLAEGFGKQSVSKADFKRYISLAIGSADETRLWLRYCLDLGYLEKSQTLRLREAYQDVAKMLTGLHRSWS